MIKVTVIHSIDDTVPEKVFDCPFCSTRNTFYAQVRENKCNRCMEIMPNVPAMFKHSIPHILDFHFKWEKYVDELIM